MKKTPAPAVQEVRAVRAVRSSYVWFSPRFALPVAVVLVMGLGTGTAFAAQGALPGDALYAIKVKVTEPALGVLAIGDEAKAQWNAQVAEVRLEEAETLAAAGRLNASTSAQIAENFDEHSNEVQALAQKVEDAEPGSGVNIAAQFDSSLAAHDAILSRLAQEDGTDNKGFADDIAAHARERGTVALALAGGSSEFNPEAVHISRSNFSIASAPAATSSEGAGTEPRKEVTPTPQTSGQIKAAFKLKNVSASALSDAQDAFDASKSSLDASTTLLIEGELARIGAAVDAATSTASLTGALKDATVLEAFLKASKKFNQNLFINRGQQGRGSSERGNKSEGRSQQEENSSSGAATVSAPTTANTTIETTIQTQTPTDSGGDNSSGRDGGSDHGGEDSFVHTLLNNF